MKTSQRIALPLVIALHLLAFYACDKLWKPLRPSQTTSHNPLIVHLVSLQPQEPSKVEASPVHKKEAIAVSKSKRIASAETARQSITAVQMPTQITNETKVAEAPPLSAGDGLLAQSALLARPKELGQFE